MGVGHGSRMLGGEIRPCIAVLAARFRQPYVIINTIVLERNVMLHINLMLCKANYEISCVTRGAGCREVRCGHSGTGRTVSTPLS